MTGPELYAKHLSEEGYHSRSNKHSNFLSQCILNDLLARCPQIVKDAKSGNLVYEINYSAVTGSGDQSIDLVLGPPGGDPIPVEEGSITCATPSKIRIGVEIKGVMTEHIKCRLNRIRDLRSHAVYIHRHDMQAIAVGVLTLNAGVKFQSKLRQSPTEHKNLDRIIPKVINEFRQQIPDRRSASDNDAHLEARTLILVECSGVVGPTKLVTKLPAPQLGDSLNYEAMIRTVCDQYKNRFG